MNMTENMTAITLKVTLISQDDGTIAVNADAFIINDKINYSFILSTFVGIFKERLTNYPSTTIFWLERSCIVTN